MYRTTRECTKCELRGSEYFFVRRDCCPRCGNSGFTYYRFTQPILLKRIKVKRLFLGLIPYTSYEWVKEKVIKE